MKSVVLSHLGSPRTGDRVGGRSGHASRVSSQPGKAVSGNPPLGRPPAPAGVAVDAQDSWPSGFQGLEGGDVLGEPLVATVNASLQSQVDRRPWIRTEYCSVRARLTTPPGPRPDRS